MYLVPLSPTVRQEFMYALRTFIPSEQSWTQIYPVNRAITSRVPGNDGTIVHGKSRLLI